MKEAPQAAPGTPPKERPWRKPALRKPTGTVGVTRSPSRAKKARVSFADEPSEEGTSTKRLNLFQSRQSDTSESPKQIRVALLEMFAGLRTCHLAVRKVKCMKFVVSHAAECCEFANALARKNEIEEVLHKDVQLLNEDWASDFIAEAVKQKADAALVVGGFPCIDLSRQQY